MTWTLTNSIANADSGSGTAEAHTAMQYLFDTYLPSKGWTVGAHPDASAFKRKLSITTAANIKGETVTMNYWANWNSVTPNQMTLYGDLTYTSVPGDLATDTATSVPMYWNSGSYAGVGSSWRFWSSDQDAGATLVTRGKKVYWYMPGFQDKIYMMLNDSSWDGSYRNNTTHVFPYSNLDVGRAARYPMWKDPTNSLTFIRPNVGSFNTTPLTASLVMMRGFTWGMTNNSSAYNDQYFYPLYTGGSDVAMVRNTINNYVLVFKSGVTTADTLLLSNGKYYLCTNTPANINSVSGNGAIAFDMGASEPDFS